MLAPPRRPLCRYHGCNASVLRVSDGSTRRRRRYGYCATWKAARKLDELFDSKLKLGSDLFPSAVRNGSESAGYLNFSLICQSSELGKSYQWAPINVVMQKRNIT